MFEDIDVEERAQRARNLFLERYNCTQAVFLAYCDLFNLDKTLLAK
jgi:hypothetical protein